MPKRMSLPTLLLLALLPAFVPATTGAAPSDSIGVLVMAHGGEPEWNAAVEKTAEALRAKWPTEVAFGMADPATLQSGVNALEAKGVRRIVVARLFLSDGSFLHQTEYLLGLRPDAPEKFLLHSHGGAHAAGGGAMAGAGHDAHAGHGMPMAHGAHAGHDGHPEADKAQAPAAPSPITHTASLAITRGGLDEYAGTGEILAERARALSKDPRTEVVVLLAHGAGDEAENDAILSRLSGYAGAIRTAAGFADVRGFTLREDWPASRAPSERAIRDYVAAHARSGQRVLVVPFRLFGFGPYRDVLKGLEYRSDGTGLLPHAAVAEWLASRVRATLDQQGWAKAADAGEVIGGASAARSER